MTKAKARALSNIAFIKYWGNRDDALRLPHNSTLSMNLAGLHTETTVEWDAALPRDTLTLNGQQATPAALERVSKHLGALRKRLGLSAFAQVTSYNNFPMGAGIASSASAFAALTVAGVAAAGIEINERELTTLARLGSGSASRSVPAGFVQWHVGHDHASSYAESIAAPTHWNLVDVIAIISEEHKTTGSQAGHPTAASSDLQAGRLQGAEARFAACKQAVLARDFAAFAEIVELDSNLMHAVMMTSHPALFYWQPATLEVMALVREWRQAGREVCYTLDAGPNVHCICLENDAEWVRNQLEILSSVSGVRKAKAGEAAQIISTN